MAFGEVWIELAKQRADDLRAESRRVGRRVGRARRAGVADGREPSWLHARTAQLVHWWGQGQLGTGIDDLSDAPLTARRRCA